MANIFSQVKGVDYEKTFSLVPRYSSIRSILELVAQMGWKIHQIDVKVTFINGVVEEKIYIEQPEGFEIYDRDSHVCRHGKALYGLKQAPQAWYTRINSFSMDWNSPKVK